MGLWLDREWNMESGPISGKGERQLALLADSTAMGGQISVSSLAVCIEEMMVFKVHRRILARTCEQNKSSGGRNSLGTCRDLRFVLLRRRLDRQELGNCAVLGGQLEIK